MEQLLALDQQLFLLINHLPHLAVSNTVALAISGVGTAGIIWFTIAILLFLREEKKDHWFFLPCILAGGTSWTIVELFLKPLIARARPNEIIGAIVVGSGGDGYSFPSGHATIAFAMAVVLSHKEPKWKWVFFALAILISFSRIYLGKHYPLDVLGGGVLGWSIGMITLFLERRLFKRSKRT